MYINVPIYGTFFIVMKGVFIMAVNEQIVTGRKFRKLIDEANKLWQRISFWTKASDVEFNDGKNAETKLGAINGVTDSLTSTASNIAASAKAVKALNDKVTQLSSNISRRYEIPVTLTSHCAATTNNDIHHGEKNVNFTIIIDNNRLTISGDTSIATGADGFAYYAIATASATIGQIVIK